MGPLRERFKNWIVEGRKSRKMLLFIVYIALFLDNMLLTTVVPIVPEYLFRLWYPNISRRMLGGEVGEATISDDQLITHPVTDDELSHYYDAELNGARVRRSFFDFDDDLREPPIKWFNASYAPPQQSFVHRRRRMRRQAPNQINEFDQAMSEEPSPGNANLLNMVLDDFDEKFKANPSDACAPHKLAKARYVNHTRLEMCRHRLMNNENMYVGLMFGSKALIQLVTNPCVGPLTNKIGYTIPMFAGFCIMFFSTILFAFGTSYTTLWIARSLQGIGSACTSTSGMGMLAQAYPDDEERGNAMGIALGGLALGVLVGPTFGGVLYEWSGKELPFVLLALLALCDGGLQFMVLQPHIDRGEPEGSSIKKLARDPYILVAVGAITIGNLGIAMLEPTLPIHMMDTMQSSSFERGIAFLPASVSYLIGTNIFGGLATKIGRWRSSLIGLIIIGFCLILIPMAESVMGLILPNGFMGFAIGMIDASMFPEMGHLVDLRHVNVYGSIYSIADAAFCFAFALGPFFSGPFVNIFGFSAMLIIIAIINFAYAPLMFMLKDPPATKHEEQKLMADGSKAGQQYGKFQEETNAAPPDPPRQQPGYGGIDEIGAQGFTIRQTGQATTADAWAQP